MRILVTGFDPFDREPVNASWEAVKRLPDEVDGAEIIKVQIPTSFARSGEVLHAAIVEHDPDVIVGVGQAGGRFAVTPERVAINVDDGRIADNVGADRHVDGLRAVVVGGLLQFAARQGDGGGDAAGRLPGRGLEHRRRHDPLAGAGLPVSGGVGGRETVDPVRVEVRSGAAGQDLVDGELGEQRRERRAAVAGDEVDVVVCR